MSQDAALSAGTAGPVPATGPSRAAVLALSERLDEPDWLRENRLEALQYFEKLPMPQGRPHTAVRRPEVYGNVVPFVPGRPQADPLAGVPQDVTGRAEELSNLLVQRDSTRVYLKVDPELEARGVVFTDLGTAAREHPELLQEYLRRSVPAREHKLTALSAALWSGGVFLYVPKGVEVETPLWVYLLRETPGLGLWPRTLVVAEPFARVTLFEAHLSVAEDDWGQHDAIVEASLADGADVTYASVQHLGHRVQNVVVQRSQGGRDSRITWINALLGGRLTKHDCESWLAAPGAHTNTLGVYYLTGNQHFDLSSLADHQAPGTTNDTLYKGALRDRSRSEYRGLIRMHKGAQKSDSYLADHNLLLSPDARADAIPGLEIEANDVRCTHGATIGHVSKEHLFYLMSRGIDRETATRMLVDGFYEPVLVRVASEAVRDRVRGFLHRKLHG